MAKKTSPLWISLSVLMAVAFGLAMTPKQDTQQNSGQQSQMQSQKVTVTGCLQKASQGNGYQITDQASNTTFDASAASDDVDLSAHVGHTVTLTGTVAPAAATTNPTTNPAGQSTNQQLSVANVKMVSSTCEKH